MMLVSSKTDGDVDAGRCGSRWEVADTCSPSDGRWQNAVVRGGVRGDGCHEYEERTCLGVRRPADRTRCTGGWPRYCIAVRM